MESNPGSVADVERAMTAIRRSQSRRTLGRLAGDHDPALFEVLDAIAERTARGEPATVTAIAELLGIDQPRASRLVARAADRGLVRREPDPNDARRVLLTTTADGRRHLDHARAFRQRIFARAMADWSEDERDTFARLLTAFVEGLDRARQRSTPGL